jgi:hypothetical protein
LAWGIALGIILEAARFVRFRLDLAQEDFNRLWNFCAILFLTAAVIVFFAEDGLGTMSGLLQAPMAPPTEAMRRVTQTAFRFFHWQPLVFFPLVVAQAYSRTPLLPWRTFSLYLQRQAKRSPQQASSMERGINTGYPYLLLVLFAASVARNEPGVFFICLVVIAAWALWPARSKRFSGFSWAAVLGLALAGTVAGQWELMVLASRLQELESRLLQQFGEAQFSLRESRTAIGGNRLKTSGRIAWRLDSGEGPPPELLREAAYNRFRPPTWGATRREPTPVAGGSDSTAWRLAPRGRGGHAATLLGYSQDGELLLPLPGGTWELRDLPASILETNRLGSTQARGLPNLVAFTVDYGATADRGAPPEDDDLDLDHLPEAERTSIRRWAAALGLADKSPQEAVAAVNRFFLDQFTYSLYQPRPYHRTEPAESPLADFLNNTKRGHCEHFATATTLLLRAAGIPTRYAVGYSVQERAGKHWIVRNRHAHAWCLAYLDGRWQDIDTTPPTWASMEALRAPAWEPLLDACSNAWYVFRRWQLETSSWKVYLFFGAVGALGYMGWRQLAQSSWRRVRAPNPHRRERIPRPGLDSEFYALERRLARRHGVRPPAETLAAWCARLAAAAPAEHPTLMRLLHLHYRLRFDPAGLTAGERQELRRQAADLSR